MFGPQKTHSADWSMRLWFFIVLSLVLSACTSSPNIKTGPLPVKKENLASWQVRGKILVQNEQGKQSGYFYYLQQPTSAKLVITSFIGTQIMSLAHTPTLSTLEIDGQTYQDPSFEALMMRYTGMALPITDLSKWMLGVKTANQTAVKLNDSQLVNSFIAYNNYGQQWQVNYGNYKQQALYMLPALMNIKGDETRLKLSLTDWEFYQ